MERIGTYQEARITFGASEISDLYAIHQRVMAVTNGDKSIAYAPVGHDHEGRMAVALRAMPGVSLPDQITAEQLCIEDGAIFTINAGVRLVKQTRFGERMPTVFEALDKWDAAMVGGGFKSHDTHMAISAVAFHHKRLNQNIRLPFWAVSSTLTVVDAEQAAATMARGVGRSRGLGFGMLRVVG